VDTKQLIRHGCPREQSIVGVYGDGNAAFNKISNRVFFVRRDHVCLHVAGRTDLERNLVIDKILQQRFVLDEGDAVSDSMSTTIEYRLSDGVGSPRFACVNRQVQEIISGVVECGQVLFGRVSLFAAGEVERDHVIHSLPHGQFSLHE
jgi:hypothetical protein